MPFLRYFVFVGLALWGLLVASNYWLTSPRATDAAIASAANEPVKDALYFWRQQEARNKTPVHHQFTAIPSTAIAAGNGLTEAQQVAAGATPTKVAMGEKTAAVSSARDINADAPVVVASKATPAKPKKVRRSAARQPSDGTDARQAYQQQQEWQQERFRQANANMNRGPFGFFW